MTLAELSTFGTSKLSKALSKNGTETQPKKTEET
jgi:hypothetical protein